MLGASSQSSCRRVRLWAVACAAGLAVSMCSLLASSASAQELCQPRANASGKECFVSPAGNDANPGTMAAPFRTVARGVSVLQAGDVLSLRGGVHVQPETLRIQALHGTGTAPIVIRSAPGEHAYIDGSVPEFRRVNNDDWEPVSGHEGEYVSRRTFTGFVRGVFLDRNPYTRLISYSNLNDLRARNETFDRITLPVCVPGQQDNCDPRPGPDVVDDKCTTPPCTPMGHRHPWVYMGPGIWIDSAVSPTNPQKVHIRLSHTHNNVPGRPDYVGEVDPRRVALAITQENEQALFIAGSSHLRFENLSIRQGGDFTVLMPSAADVTFDHVRVFASTHGIRMGQVSDTTFSNCEFNGGTPTWLFRSDQKSPYTYVDNGVPVVNNLGNRTSRVLMVPSVNNIRTTIKNCEFVNGHDLYLEGQDVVFHHNWIDNLNDEGLFLDSSDSPNMRIHQNVILRTLSPIGFAGGKDGGHQYIYRNLIDVREPTAGYRPKFTGDVDIWRYGNTFKSNSPDGPYDVFQNTFLVYAQHEQASYMHYRNMQDLNARRSFNNVFVAVNPNADSDVPITFLPAPSFPAQTDGNNYHRIGQATTPPYRYLGYEFPAGTTFRAGTFDCLRNCPRPLIGSMLFQQSTTQYPPGYEANSIESDPQFIRLGPDGTFRDNDDLRLSATSPARAAGVPLPADLQALDSQVIPPSGSAPDIGAYPFGAAPLAVGIDGRRSYPTTP